MMRKNLSACAASKPVIWTLVIAALLISMLALNAGTTVFAADRITKEEAVDKALKNANVSKSQVYALEAETKTGKYEIEFMKKKNNAEYEYDISKKGRILEKSIDYSYRHNSSKSKIGKSAAQKKVAKISGFDLSVIKKGTCRYEYDDNEGTYKIKFRKGHYRYKYELLAPTGKLVEFGKKYVK